MKLAIFSDIHGNYQALKAIFKKIGNDYDEVIFLGDAIGIGPDSYECVKLLQEKKVRFISGNHDLYYIRGPQIDEDLKGLHSYKTSVFSKSNILRIPLAKPHAKNNSLGAATQMGGSLLDTN